MARNIDSTIMITLSVVDPFNYIEIQDGKITVQQSYVRGDRISDQARVNAILNSEYVAYVVKVGGE